MMVSPKGRSLQKIKFFTLLAMIICLAVQSSTQTLSHNAILLIDTITMLDTPKLVIASNEESLGSCNVLVIKKVVLRLVEAHYK